MRMPWLPVLAVFLAQPARAQIPEPTPPPAEGPPAAVPAQPPPPEPEVGGRRFDEGAATPPTGNAERATEGGLTGEAQATVERVLPDAAGDVTAEVDENGALIVEGVVPLLSDKLEVHDALTELPQADIVVNRLAIAAPRRSDTVIARDVRRRLHNDPTLRNLGLQVQVEHQEVFLRGRAPSGLDVALAVHAAAEVRGVRDVHTERLEASVPYR